MYGYVRVYTTDQDLVIQYAASTASEARRLSEG